MTTRHVGYVVTLEEPIREDDAEATINAIRMIRGVISVTPIERDTGAEIVAVSRTKNAVLKKLMNVYEEISKM